MSEVFKKWVLKDIDLSTISDQRDFEIFFGKEPNLISVHIDWEGLTGDEFNASVKLLQKNDSSLKWSEISALEVILNSESDSIILENTEWGGEILGLRLEMNDCTGGILNAVVIAKNK